MKYTPSPDVLTANLQGESVLLDMHSKDYYRLNETAACVWRRLETVVERGLVTGDELQTR